MNDDVLGFAFPRRDTTLFDVANRWQHGTYIATIMAAAARNLIDFAIQYEDDDLFEFGIENMINNMKVPTFDVNWTRFDLASFTEAQCLDKFRFCKDDIRNLVTVLEIPPVMSLKNRCVVDAEDALCMTLRRFVYPNRLTDLEKLFGRPKSVLSLAINETVDFLYERHGHLLTRLDQPWMDRDHLSSYAEAIHDAGSPLEHCFGFIDGTVRPICRPIRFQRAVFNGHKRVHAIKFQSLTLPNGIIGNLWGPVEGRRHDAGILRESGLLDQLNNLPQTENGEPFCIYGDPAYPIRPWLISPFRQGAMGLNQQQQDFNRAMSELRISVEWTFGKILKYWAFVDYKKDLKVFLQPVGKYYLVAGLLTNCHTCMYGSQSGIYFDMEAPALRDYIAN